MTATLRLRADQLTKMRRLAGLDTDTALANRMGVDPGNLSRVIRGKQQPGATFIASLVDAFPGFTMDDLFEVVPQGEPIAS